MDDMDHQGMREPAPHQEPVHGGGAAGTAGIRSRIETTEAAEEFSLSSARTRLHLLAPLSTRVFNPLTRLVAGRVPGLGVLTHTGRRTRRRYRTPLLVLRRGDDYVVALWYGSDVHWLKNVLAAGSCELRTRGRNVPLAEPRLVADPARRILPRPLRWAGSVVGLTEFLRLRAVGR